MKFAFLSLVLILALPGQQTADQAFEKAVGLQQTGKLTEAEQAYRVYLKQFGAKPEALANLGAVLVRLERFDEAISTYSRALKLAPEVLPIRVNLGLAHFKSGQLPAAVEQFSAVLARQPGNSQVRQLRAMSLLELERFNEAIADYSLLMPSDDVNVRLGLASAYMHSGRLAEAQKLIEPLFESDSAEVKLLLSQILIENGQLDEALKALERAAELNPRLPTIHLNIGAVHWRRQETEAAIEEWRKELSAHPESFQANYTLGAGLALKPQYAEEAAKLLRKAMALKPGNAMAPYQLAKLIWRRSQAKEAVSLLERSAKADPKYHEARYLLASIYQSLGRKEDAAREFAAVRQIKQESQRRSQDLFESAR